LFLIDPDGKADAFKAFQGYYKNPEATNKKVARDVLKKGDYFFRTGDVLKLHYDGSRRYTAFEDRIGDTFRWKGENVSTMVISAVLNVANWQEVAAVIGAYPGVDDANVYGVRLPHHDGRVGCVALELSQNSDFNFFALATHLNKILPRYAIPVFVRLTHGMALTGNMKHQKHGMREEGIDPTKVKGDKVLWLKNGSYVEFTEQDWTNMNAGQVKL
jgi:acyl-CoA synthetase (AMP-forming)/AMP-acid ligase II